MKQILITLFVLMALVTTVNAGALYSCNDRDGNVIITSIPQEGMINCELKDEYNDPTPQERAKQESETLSTRNKYTAETEKLYRAEREREANNQRANPLLDTDKDAGHSLPSQYGDRTEQTAEVKAEQISEGTDRALTTAKDAAFNREQATGSQQSKINVQSKKSQNKQPEVDKTKR